MHLLVFKKYINFNFFIILQLSWEFSNLLLINYYTKTLLLVKILQSKNFIIDNNHASNKLDLHLGVPQGIAIWTIFFSLFINDLTLYITGLIKKLSADYTKLYRSANDCSI